MAGFTRVQLREAVARLFGMYEGVVSAAGMGVHPSNAPGYDTFYDYDLAVYADDYWNGADIYIKTMAGGGAPQGESSKISNFTSASGYLFCSPAFTVSPAVGSTYQIYQSVTKAQIDRALNQACMGAEVATSLTPSTTSLDYQLAAAIGLYRRQQMIGVWVRDLGNDDSLPWQVQGWQLEDAEGLLTLRLPQLLTASDQVWIVYTLGENGMSNDTQTVNMPMALVVARSAVYLYQELLDRQGPSGRESIGQKLRYWEEKLQAEERKYGRPSAKARAYSWGTLFANRDRVSEALNIRTLYRDA